MRPVSEGFLACVSGSHEVVTEARVLTVDGELTDIPLTDGTVTLDSSASIRGRCDIQVDNTEWIPTDSSDRLAPFGNEINLCRGVRLSDGSTETVSLGWFGIEDGDVTDDGNGAGARVSAYDRSKRISDASFEDTFQLAAGTPFVDGIQQVVLDAWPDCPVDDGVASASTISFGKPVTAQAGDNRWEFVQGLATALGMVLFFDGDGVLVLRPYGLPGVAAELVEGEGGVLVTAARNWSRTEAHNRWVVTGEASGGSSVYRGVATDDNPLSPTYYDGPFGRCPGFWSSDQITSNSQAADAAAALLAQHAGVASTVSFGMVPNPALEPEDMVRISRPSVGVDENHVVDSLTVGLGASELMTGSTRERWTF